MERIDFKQIVERMKAHGLTFCDPVNLHVPCSGEALRSALEYFIGSDFVWLPEYAGVAEWLDNNRGRGLCLYGTNGTGKTVLIQKAIPSLLFKYCRKVVKCFNCSDLNGHTGTVTGMRLLSIDDVGLESECVSYGNRRWIFPEIMDMAEKRNSVVIFSTNLDGQGLRDRYGVRTFERIVSTTVRIELKHPSLRK
jgi:DNA replication protein DnaC